MMRIIVIEGADAALVRETLRELLLGVSPSAAVYPTREEDPASPAPASGKKASKRDPKPAKVAATGGDLDARIVAAVAGADEPIHGGPLRQAVGGSTSLYYTALERCLKTGRIYRSAKPAGQRGHLYAVTQAAADGQ